MKSGRFVREFYQQDVYAEIEDVDLYKGLVVGCVNGSDYSNIYIWKVPPGLSNPLKEGWKPACGFPSPFGAWNTGTDPDFPRITEAFQTTPPNDPELGARELEEFPKYVLRGDPNDVHCVRMVDDRTVISGSHNGCIRVWNLHDGTSSELLGHTDTVFCVDANDHLIASGSADKTIRLWSRGNHECVGMLCDHHGMVGCLDMHDTHMVSGSFDNNAILWDIERACSLRTLTGHESVVTCVQMDKTKVVSGSSTIRMWDRRMYKSVVLGGGRSRRIIMGISFNDVEVTSIDSNLDICVWDFAAGAYRSVSSMRSNGVPLY
jgi:WD40 repeat protein